MTFGGMGGRGGVRFLWWAVGPGSRVDSRLRGHGVLRQAQDEWLVGDGCLWFGLGVESQR